MIQVINKCGLGFRVICDFLHHSACLQSCFLTKLHLEVKQLIPHNLYHHPPGHSHHTIQYHPKRGDPASVEKLHGIIKHKGAIDEGIEKGYAVMGDESR